MRFSSRIQPGDENALARRLAEKRAAGVPLRDLTLANPTQAGLEYPAERILAALAPPAALVYEPAPRGLPSARAAVAARLPAAGTDPERVILTASTSEAYAWLFKLSCDPGDAVLAPEPSYPLFAYLAALEGVALAPYPLAYDGAWHVDFSALEAAITPRTRAVLFVSPNNPTGSYLKQDEHLRLLEICARHDLALVCDEVFAAFPAEDAPDPTRVTFAAGTDGPALVFSLGGLSKSAGLPQLKLGWIVVSGPPDTVATALARLELIADSYLSVATPVQLAAPALLDAGAEIAARILARVRDNRARLRAAFGPALLPAEGGWSAILRLPATRTDEELALALLDDHDTLVHPGYFFDFPRGTYLVLSLLPPPALFDAGVEAILSLA